MKKYWLLILIITSAVLLVHFSQRNDDQEKSALTQAGGEPVEDRTRTNNKYEFYEELQNRPVHGK